MVKIFTKEDALAALGSGLTDTAENFIRGFAGSFGSGAIFGLNTGTLITALAALWFYHGKAKGIMRPIAYGVGITAAGKMIKPFLAGFTGGLVPQTTTQTTQTTTTALP